MARIARPHRRTCPCGWAGSYTGPGIADRELGRHDCTADWTPRPCGHGGIHVHGTPACAKHCGCRCEPCRTALADAAITTKRNRAYGRARLVNAGPSREHLTLLAAHGIGYRHIANLTGHDPKHLWQIRSGKLARVTVATEAMVLAIAVPPSGHASVDPADTTRRLQALAAIGYDSATLAARAGLGHPEVLSRIRAGGRRAVAARTALLVHQLYTDLAATPAPGGFAAAYARRVAARHGWPPPLTVAGRVLTGTPVPAEGAIPKRQPRRKAVA